MKRSTTKPEIELATPSESSLRRAAHLEPFNGSRAMLAIRESIEDREAVGPRQAILTVGGASDSLWTRTVTIAFFSERA